MRRENLKFRNTRGEELSGVLELPVNEPRAYALFAHCFTCTKNFRAARLVSQALAAEGIAVLRFDFTGLGQSEGDFADTNFSTNVEDLVAAAEHLGEVHEPPTILVGHSLGGTAVLVAAASVPSARAVATIGSPVDAAHVAHLLSGDREVIEAQGEADVLLAGRPFKIRKQFLDDIAEQNVDKAIRGLRRALMVMHSPVDDTVDVANAAEIFGRALHPKSFVTLDKADHLLSRDEDARYVGAVLAAWAARYLDPAPERKALDGEGDVAARTEAGGFITEIDAQGHALVADEPASVGGTDAGPTPYGLLSAALGTCTTMTLQMYARHKKLPLDAATVHVAHDRIHAEDCAECESGEGRIDRFRRSLKLDGPLTDDQRSRMLEIADRCPVHRTLHSEVVIETRLEDE